MGNEKFHVTFAPGKASSRGEKVFGTYKNLGFEKKKLAGAKVAYDNSFLATYKHTNRQIKA